MCLPQVVCFVFNSLLNRGDFCCLLITFDQAWQSKLVVLKKSSIQRVKYVTIIKCEEIIKQYCRPSDLLCARAITAWFQNMAHHFPRQWVQWAHPFWKKFHHQLIIMLSTDILLDLRCETPQASFVYINFTHKKQNLSKRWYLGDTAISPQISPNKPSFTYISIFIRSIPQ